MTRVYAEHCFLFHIMASENAEVTLLEEKVRQKLRFLAFDVDHFIYVGSLVCYSTIMLVLLCLSLCFLVFLYLRPVWRITVS